MIMAEKIKATRTKVPAFRPRLKAAGSIDAWIDPRENESGGAKRCDQKGDEDPSRFPIQPTNRKEHERDQAQWRTDCIGDSRRARHWLRISDSHRQLPPKQLCQLIGLAFAQVLHAFSLQ